jgi:hypothetical protein
MASAWIIRRQTKSGPRYRVLFRLGGREATARYAGSFPTRAQALERRRWVDGELSAMRVPDVQRLEAPAAPVTLRPRRNVGAAPGLMSQREPRPPTR